MADKYDPSLWNIVINGVVAISAAGFGAFSGAWLADRQRKKDREKEKYLDEIINIQSALHIIGIQYNALLNYKQAVLDKHENNEFRYIFLPAVRMGERSHVRQEKYALAFLLGTKNAKLCFDVAMADEKFHSTVDSIETRVKFREVSI